MEVCFLDLKAQYASIKDRVSDAMEDVIGRCAFAGGPFVRDFEDAFARFCGCAYAVGTSSGTSAIWMSLLGLGIGPGDEVITVPNTFIATAEAITFCGARPVFVDIDEKTYNMNAELLEEAITPRTKAVIPVHLYGQTADMTPVMEVAGEHGLHVIEDACQAHGAEYNGRRAGSMGQAGCFSFYPGKNLGAYGEAGAVVTNDAELAERMRMLRDHGQSKKHCHSIIGWNGRMDGLQGAVLKVKLEYLEKWNEARRANAALYNELLSGMEGIVAPTEAVYARHVWHIYCVRVKKRDALMAYLGEHGVSCGIHYPVPLHLQKAYESLGYEAGRFPVAEACCREIVSLPMFPELSEDQVRFVCSEIGNFLKARTDSQECRV